MSISRLCMGMHQSSRFGRLRFRARLRLRSDGRMRPSYTKIPTQANIGLEWGTRASFLLPHSFFPHIVERNLIPSGVVRPG